jgi:hypothetical protein
MTKEEKTGHSIIPTVMPHAHASFRCHFQICSQGSHRNPRSPNAQLIRAVADSIRHI